MRSNGSGGSPSPIVGYGTVAVQPDLLSVDKLSNLRVEQDDVSEYVTGLTVGGVPVRVRLDEVVQVVKGTLSQNLADLTRLQEMQQSGGHREWLATGLNETQAVLAAISTSIGDLVAAANPALNVYAANGSGFDIRLSQSNCTKPPTLRLFAAGVDVPPEMVGLSVYLPSQRGADAIRFVWDRPGNQLLLVAVCGRLQDGEQKGRFSAFVQGKGRVFAVEAIADCESGLRITSGIVGEAIAPPNVVGQQTNIIAA